MIEFVELRKRHLALIEKITSQLESKEDDFTSQDAGVFEKMIKGCVLLEIQCSKSGVENEYKNSELDELEKDFT